MDKYKEEVNKISMKGSDKKKLLALPYSMSLRAQLPEPKRGMEEWEIFEEWAGVPWDHFGGYYFDDEKKVTEFDYEKFIPKVILDQFDKDSVEFKNYIKRANIFSKTKIEMHKDKQEEFKEYMPLFAGLTRHEKESLLHAIMNRRGNRYAELEAMISGEEEKILSKI